MSSEVEGLPLGSVRFAWFGGIMEGSVRDLEALGALVQEINGLGLVSADLELDRGRFSLLFEQNVVAGSQVTQTRSQRLVDFIGQVVALSDSPESLESTLNCTEVYEEGVVETLFAIREGVVDGVSRRRAVRPGDLAKNERSEAGPGLGLPNMSRPLVVLLLVLFLMLGGLMAWRNGLLDQIASARVESLQMDTDSFQGLLNTEIEGDWGNYRVSITRGPNFPVLPEDVDRLEQEAKTTVEIAAIRTVAGGNRIFVQLLDKEMKVLDAAGFALSGLLRGEERVQVNLRGHARARSIRLTKDIGLPSK